jgi:polyphosphate kinase 2 (PPK2 family)
MQSEIPKELDQQELDRLQTDVVYVAEWIKQEQARVIVVFEGVDAAGKGGVIKRITEYVSPRVVRTRPAGAERPGTDAVVFPALHRAVPGRRRGGTI